MNGLYNNISRWDFAPSAEANILFFLNSSYANWVAKRVK